MAEESLLQLEDQYLLRLPPSLSRKVRKLVKAGGFDGIRLEFPNNSRKGFLHIGEKAYPATLADLPTVIETHKTLNNQVFYKSGDIGQTIIVDDPDAPPIKSHKVDESFAMLDGLTPPTHNIKKRRFREKKHYPHQKVAEVERELQARADTGSTINTEVTYETIDANEVEAVYDLPDNDNTIVVMKNGPPILGGDPTTWSNKDIAFLPPDHQRKVLAAIGEILNIAVESPAVEQATGTTPSPSPSPSPLSVTVTVPPKVTAELLETKRRRRNDLKNSIATLERKLEANREKLASETNQVMKQRLEEKIPKENAKIVTLMGTKQKEINEIERFLRENNAL